MSQLQRRISPCLWFDNQAEAAANFYTGIFQHSRIRKITHYTEAGRDTHRKPAGSVMTVEFELDGQPFTALNGGPEFKFNEAVSFQIHCQTQEDIDYFWERLSAGGDPKAQVCGWLKDRYGVSWQVVPDRLIELLSDDDNARASRVMNAMLKMKKIDLNELERAAKSDVSSLA
ncbi:MAG TPA: VOC family protein [Vicinamibacterales bacterium]|nr:VOC family protein [Vicinamibacterales bacterium]